MSKPLAQCVKHVPLSQFVHIEDKSLLLLPTNEVTPAGQVGEAHAFSTEGLRSSPGWRAMMWGSLRMHLFWYEHGTVREMEGTWAAPLDVSSPIECSPRWNSLADEYCPLSDKKLNLYCGGL